MINDKHDNKVQLIGFYGDDKVHACSAWTSTSRDLNEDKINRIPKLLKMLADAGHHTPFEKSSLHFLVDTDIASHIHLIKHRSGVSRHGDQKNTSSTGRRDDPWPARVDRQKILRPPR